MLNISMVRVDERLVHGQIIIKWLEAKKANKIVVIDDEVASDPIMEKVLNMTLPKNIELNVCGLEDGANFLRKKDSEDNVILLVKSLWAVKELYKRGVNIKEVNIGRIPSDVGKRMVHSNVFLSDEDIDIIEFLRKEEVSVIIQMVPDSRPINVHDLEL